MVSRGTHGPRTYVPRLWLIDLVKLGYSFNVHAWLPFCIAIWICIVKNPDAPFKCWKQDRWLVIKWLSSVWCTSLFLHYNQSRPPCINFGAADLTICSLCCSKNKFTLNRRNDILLLCNSFSLNMLRTDLQYSFSVSILCSMCTNDNPMVRFYGKLSLSSWFDNQQ